MQFDQGFERHMAVAAKADAAQCVKPEQAPRKLAEAGPVKFLRDAAFDRRPRKGLSWRAVYVREGVERIPYGLPPPVKVVERPRDRIH